MEGPNYFLFEISKTKIIRFRIDRPKLNMTHLWGTQGPKVQFTFQTFIIASSLVSSISKSWLLYCRTHAVEQYYIAFLL